MIRLNEMNDALKRNYVDSKMHATDPIAKHTT